ncbi:MAG TPA: hypothetical protein VK155_04420 [Bacteroidales bacterium]|nr:hypothetical protein [Bacteroidales bacterium]
MEITIFEFFKKAIMHPVNIFFSSISIFLLSCLNVFGQAADTITFSLNSRLSFYTYEKNAEFLLHVPEKLLAKNLDVTVTMQGDTLGTWSGKAPGKIVRIPVSLSLNSGEYRLYADIKTSAPVKLYRASAALTILKYKSNEVKTDRLTGGLVVNKLPYFPFGFYTYSPVDPTLPEEEVVRGFNMISPYQKIAPETFAERKVYMDRCAQLGMKVHYNLLSVSGGGGVGSRINGLSDEEKKSRLLAEIAAIRDHPALLGWYIADEPNGYKIPPRELEDIYNLIRENDPWHPVSIVFMAPFTAAKKYENALDIVMADPYPLPDLPVTLTGNVAQELREAFAGTRPVWMVPQAFGGGELWSREPTIQEIRSMTWQSIINGATGIQYFVRRGPNYFPKSPSTWAECGRIAMEVSELTPWILSDEETLPVESSSKNIAYTSRMHDGKLVIMAVNKINEPVTVSFRIYGERTASATSLFENRRVAVRNGILTDYIAPFGSAFYMVDTQQEISSSTGEKNLQMDGGFEDLSSPGIPAACYARPGGDRGATYFIDSRVHHDGDHSLRLVTPEMNKSVALSFFPVRLKAGSSYIISMWAKADPEQRFRKLPPEESRPPVLTTDPQYVEITLGDFCHAFFVPGSEWKQYVTFVTIPSDTSSGLRTNLVLRMPGQGVAWFDQIRVVEQR